MKSKQSTKTIILSVAEALFAKHGYHGVSMHDISDAASITKAALYYHFPDGKEQLAHETVMHALAEARGEFSKKRKETYPNATEALVHMMQLFADAYDKHAAIINVLESVMRTDNCAYANELWRGICQEWHPIIKAYYVESERVDELEYTDQHTELFLTLMQGAFKKMKLIGPFNKSKQYIPMMCTLLGIKQ
jgi:TetR/AcrR family transcriptional repressor of lmrAB and yxaGH operons